MQGRLKDGRHVHVIPVDPALTVEEAWLEIKLMGLRTTHTGECRWGVVACDGEECWMVSDAS